MNSIPGNFNFIHSLPPSSQSRLSLSHLTASSPTPNRDRHVPAVANLLPPLTRTMPQCEGYHGESDRFAEFDNHDDSSLNSSSRLPSLPPLPSNSLLDNSYDDKQHLPGFGSESSFAGNDSPPQGTVGTRTQNSSSGPKSFADFIATSFGFGDSKLDRNMREMLHGLEEMGQGLTKADIVTRVFMLACVFFVFMKLMTRMAEINEFTSLLHDLKIRLGDTFEVTREQSTRIRKVAKGLILLDKRPSYLDLYIDVNDECKKNAKVMLLDNIYGNPTREDTFIAVTKRLCSGVRNNLREDLRDSVSGPKRCSLDRFIELTVHKYRRVTDDSRTVSGALRIRLAILRRLAWENKDILGIAEVVLDEEDGDEDGDGESNTLTPITNLINDDSTATKSYLNKSNKKRKRNAKEKAPKKTRGRAAGEGKDKGGFWSIVDDWFEEKVKLWGPKLNEPGWQKYVDDCYRIEAQWLKSNQLPSISEAIPSMYLENQEGNTENDQNVQDGSNIEQFQRRSYSGLGSSIRSIVSAVERN